MKQRSKQIVFTMLMALLCLAGCAQKAERISLYALLVHPEAYEDQLVTVRGILYKDPAMDGYALYMKKWDAKYNNYFAAIWLGNLEEVEVKTGQTLEELNKQDIELTGRVKNKKGPQEAHCCQIESVKQVAKLEIVNGTYRGPTPGTFPFEEDIELE